MTSNVKEIHPLITQLVKCGSAEHLMGILLHVDTYKRRQRKRCFSMT